MDSSEDTDILTETIILTIELYDGYGTTRNLYDAMQGLTTGVTKLEFVLALMALEMTGAIQQVWSEHGLGWRIVRT